MKSKQNILDQINSDVYGSNVIEISSLIYDYLILGRENIHFISLGILRNHISSYYSDQDILITARVLTILRYPILDECYDFIDGENMIVIQKKDVYRALSKGEKLYHPETGDEIIDFQNRINVFYKPNEQFLIDLSKNE